MIDGGVVPSWRISAFLLSAIKSVIITIRSAKNDSEGEDQNLKDNVEGKPWSLDGWKIARKPEMAQRAMWQQLFRSDLSPLNQVKDGRTWSPPWRGGAGWDIDGRVDYVYTGTGPTALEWDSRSRPIDDYYSYNEAFETNIPGPHMRYPVGDVRISMGVQPEKDGLGVEAVVLCRGHEFVTSITGTKVEFLVRDGADAKSFRSIGTATLDAPLAAGKVTNLEFWHADQELQLWVEGKLIGKADYEWTPADRLKASTGITIPELVTRDTLPNGTQLEIASVHRCTNCIFDSGDRLEAIVRIPHNRTQFDRPIKIPLKFLNSPYSRKEAMQPNQTPQPTRDKVPRT
jgi:hypothetical protein